MDTWDISDHTRQSGGSGTRWRCQGNMIHWFWGLLNFLVWFVLLVLSWISWQYGQVCAVYACSKGRIFSYVWGFLWFCSLNNQQLFQYFYPFLKWFFDKMIKRGSDLHFQRPFLVLILQTVLELQIDAAIEIEMEICIIWIWFFMHEYNIFGGFSLISYFIQCFARQPTILYASYIYTIIHYNVK